MADRGAAPCCADETCGQTRGRRTVTDYLLRPRYRTDAELRNSAGQRVATADGAGIQIAIETDASCVRSLQYRASSCATLVAYAEVLGDLVLGKPLDEVARITPPALMAILPGVPVSRQDRATAVIHATWSALAAAVGQNQTPATKGSSN